VFFPPMFSPLFSHGLSNKIKGSLDCYCVDGGEISPQSTSQPPFCLGSTFNFAVASLNIAAQVLIWVGMDNLVEEWLFVGTSGTQEEGDEGECINWVGLCHLQRHYYHNLIFMGIGLLGLVATCTLLEWGCRVDRLDIKAPPYIHSFLKPPNWPVTPTKVVRVFIRNFFSNAFYYLHLSGFWYLLDEDFQNQGLPQKTTRNLLYIAVGFVVQFLSGNFWRDAG